MYIYKLYFNIFGICVFNCYIFFIVKYKISESYYICRLIENFVLEYILIFWLGFLLFVNMIDRKFIGRVILILW